MHPVDGEITPPLLGSADELTAQLRPGGLRRNRLRLEDVQVTGHALDGAAALQQVVQAPAAAHVVVGQVSWATRGEDNGRSCRARYRSISWYLVTQSISRAILSRFPVSIDWSARSHISSTRSLIAFSPLELVKSRARVRYSYWISSALISRPLASLTRLRPVMSWLTSRIARIGLSSVMSRGTTPASIIRSTRSVEPTLSSMVVSLMLASPTITCRRRKRSASACGSSLVLMIGRDLVVAEETLSQMCSARWLTQYTAPRGVCSTFPAPQIICRVTRNGVRMSVSRPSSSCRGTR